MEWLELVFLCDFRDNIATPDNGPDWGNLGVGARVWDLGALDVKRVGDGVGLGADSDVSRV